MLKLVHYDESLFSKQGNDLSMKHYFDLSVLSSRFWLMHCPRDIDNVANNRAITFVGRWRD